MTFGEVAVADVHEGTGERRVGTRGDSGGELIEDPAGWAAAEAALIRPDGHVAWATEDTAGTHRHRTLG